MNELSLFAGAGGGILGGTISGFETVCAVEIDPYCREILLRRQRDRVLPLFPVWDDVKTFAGGSFRGKVDIISAGFPCQPFSVAGKRKGEADERNIWPDTIRIIREVGPQFALLENVPGLLAHPYFGTILGDLAEAWYHAEWAVLGASDIGANHRRKRLWILANADEMRELQPKRGKREKRGWPRDGSYNVAHAQSHKVNERKRRIMEKETTGREGFNATVIPSGPDVADPTSKGQAHFKRCGKDAGISRLGAVGRSSWWLSEPDVGRVADELANRMDCVGATSKGEL